MRKLLLATTLVLATSIGVAKAQNAPTTTTPQTTQPSQQTTQPSEGGAMMRGMMGGRMMGGGMRRREMGERAQEHMMMQTTAAIFRIQQGDTSIFIKCAENESMQACITAAGTLLDKFNSHPSKP
jgi:predicted lipid-binding transport protein (Tim44 family)